MQELTALAPWLLSSTPLEGLHPGDWSAITLEDRFPTEWPDAEKELPHRTFAADRRKALKWGFERAVLRIFVDFLDRWQRGDLELRGRRPDGVVEPVAPTWRCSRFMALHLRNGLFVRAPWRGQAPPADLPHYSDLTVWSVERQSPLLPAATPPEQATGRQDDPAPEASRALPLANDDQVHACIDALYPARKDDEPVLTREIIYARAPDWLARQYKVWAPQKLLRTYFAMDRHSRQRRARGEH